MSLLDVRGLTMRFGGLTAVNKVDFKVDEGQIVSVIGPNGAGKTTVFNAITGIYEPTEGDVLFRGRDLARLRDRDRAPREGRGDSRPPRVPRRDAPPAS